MACGGAGADEAKSSQLLAMRVDLGSVKHHASIAGAMKCLVRSFRTRFDDNDEKVQYYGPDPLLMAHAPRGRNGQNARLSLHHRRIEL